MPNISVRDIDEQIEKLQKLRNVMSDPQMAALLNQLLASKNGQSMLPFGNTQREYKAKKRGGFIGKIEETCRAFGTGTFTINDVIKAFEEHGNAFTAKNKSVATYSAMRRLQKRKVLEVVERGEGSAPSTYRIVQ